MSCSFLERKRRRAERALGRKPANQPMRAAAAGAVIHFAVVINGMISPRMRVEVIAAGLRPKSPSSFPSKPFALSTSDESLGFGDDPIMAGTCHLTATPSVPGAAQLLPTPLTSVEKRQSHADFNEALGIAVGWSECSLAGGGPVESNERFYRRRAVEERTAARRAVSDTARAWHAKLAEDFAQRATACTAMIS